MDKIGYALELVATGARFFLSRSRQTGKSRFLDTLAGGTESSGCGSASGGNGRFVIRACSSVSSMATPR